MYHKKEEFTLGGGGVFFVFNINKDRLNKHRDRDREEVFLPTHFYSLQEKSERVFPLTEQVLERHF